MLSQSLDLLFLSLVLKPNQFPIPINMRRIFHHFTTILFITLLISNTARAQKAYQIFNTNGDVVTFEELVTESIGKSHVFFGEYHNNPIVHWLQLELTNSLFLQKDTNLVLGAEMFEADVQIVIDEYFKDLIKQSAFESEARLWTNYKTDYKPLLEFAKLNKIKFIATNIPRRYANSVFHNGLEKLEEMSALAKSYIAPLPISPDTTLTSYREILKMGAGHNGKYMMEAQTIKDATMAHFISKNSSKNMLFLHFNGSYHSDKREGIIPFLPAHIDRENILTISTVSQEEVDLLNQDNQQLADFIICVNDKMTKTH